MLKALKRNEKGLTLIELLAVLVIVGIIAAIAIPAIGGTITKSKTNADNATKKMIEEVAMRYLIDTDADSTETITFASLVSGGYLNSDVTWQNDANDDFDAITATYKAAGDPLWAFTFVNNP